VTRDNDAWSQFDDAVEPGDPVLHRTHPHDRGDAHEDEIARKHGAFIGHMHDQVAGAVRRAHLDQLDSSTSDLQLHGSAKGLGRKRQRYPLEVIGGQQACEGAHASELPGPRDRGEIEALRVTGDRFREQRDGAPQRIASLDRLQARAEAAKQT
jgi:hypothetical protein